MNTIRELNIENRPHFFNSMTNIKNIDPSLLSITKYHLKVLMMLFMTLNILKIPIVQILFIHTLKIVMKINT